MRVTIELKDTPTKEEVIEAIEFAQHMAFNYSQRSVKRDYSKPEEGAKFNRAILFYNSLDKIVVAAKKL